MGLFASVHDGKRIFHKTAAEIELMRNANLLVSKTLAHVGSILKAGVTGEKIDQAAEEFIRDHGGKPARFFCAPHRQWRQRCCRHPTRLAAQPSAWSLKLSTKQTVKRLHNCAMLHRSLLAGMDSSV